VDDDHVLRIVERIVAPLGRRIDEASPMVDARLPDGSRVNAIIPPLSLVGPSVTIRKFKKDQLTVDDLVRFGSFTEEFAQFLRAAVYSRLNIIVSGGTGSGKTTTLNVLSSFIPPGDRIVTIEDAAELQLRQPHVVRLEKRPPNIEGKGEISIRELVVNSLRMRPDRVVVGECRSGEALDMLQAMNTGHDGSLTTVHSNSARDTLNRLETLVLMSGIDLPVRAIRQQISSAVDMIIHQERMRDGGRRIVQASEVVGMEGDTIVMQDIFVFQQTGYDEKGKIMGQLEATGLRPRVGDRIEEAGIKLPPNIFGLNFGS
jgi:pilus assembly protein CpaF